MPSSDLSVPIKCVSLWQPWAWWLASGDGKTCETRSLPPRGEFRPSWSSAMPGASLDAGETVAIHATVGVGAWRTPTARDGFVEYATEPPRRARELRSRNDAGKFVSWREAGRPAGVVFRPDGTAEPLVFGAIVGVMRLGDVMQVRSRVQFDHEWPERRAKRRSVLVWSADGRRLERLWRPSLAGEFRVDSSDRWTDEARRALNSSRVGELSSGDWGFGRWIWAASSTVLFKEPIEARGAQGVWRLSVPQIEAVAAAMDAGRRRDHDIEGVQ